MASSELMFEHGPKRLSEFLTICAVDPFGCLERSMMVVLKYLKCIELQREYVTMKCLSQN